jgi:ATP-dependent Clp protease ATP-binding subunit ClpB
MDASNMLKPASRAASCTASAPPRSTSTASTSRRTRRWRAASSRSSSAEPSVEDTVSILRGLKEKYELHHGVRITDGAIVAAADALQPLHHRPLPARQGDRPRRRGGGAAAHGGRFSKPEEIDELDRRIIQLKIEREALKKERTRPQGAPRQKLEKELAELEQESGELTARWQAEKEKLAGRQKLKEQLDQARHELDQAQRQGDSPAGELTYGVIPELEKKLAEAEEQARAPACSRRR